MLFGKTYGPMQGPYKTKRTEVTVGGFLKGYGEDALVYYPQASEGAKFPLISFMHGDGGGGHLVNAYVPLLE